MVTATDVQCIRDQLASATTFTAVFGPLAPGGVSEQRSALRRSFGYLVKLVHPDMVPASQEKVASETFQLLDRLRHQADTAIQSGTYDQPFSGNTPSPNGHDGDTGFTILQSASETYRLVSTPTWTGDFSALYRAEALTGKQPVIVKIAAQPKDNARLEWEALVLSRFNGPKAKSTLRKVSVFVPHLLDTFMVAGESGKRYRANVTTFHPGLVSLTEIRNAFPSGLDPRDAAWIFRRVLGQTSAAAMADVVHGAIVPDHVLVEPIKHEPLHIGWSTAVEPGKRITTVVNRWRPFYPPEVFRKEPVDHRADLFMAGQTMIYLLGGDVKSRKLPAGLPVPVASIIRSCIAEDPARRPKDGRVVLDEFTQAIREAWGRTYRPLILTGR